MMNIKTLLRTIIIISIITCGIIKADGSTMPQITSLPQDVNISDSTAGKEMFALGSVSKENNPYKLELSFTPKGAAVTSVRLRDYDNRDSKNPQPLELLNSVDEAKSFSSREIKLPNIYKNPLSLDKFEWKVIDIQKTADIQKITFATPRIDVNDKLIEVRKTYTLKPESYLVDCKVSIVNLSDAEVKASFDMFGPVGIKNEDQRTDTRTVTTGFLDPQGIVDVTKLNIKKILKDSDGKAELFYKDAECKFLWTSISSKYFTSIIRPVPTEPNVLYSDWIAGKYALYFDNDPVVKNDENIGVSLKTQTATIAPMKEITYDFQLYIGPKDRNLFNSVPLYAKLGFIKVIDFQACCGNVFSSLSFAVLTAMDWLYKFIPNYGIVIIIFVLVVRVLLHPITKKSQVSMMRMSKLAPMAEEIKKKYGDNKAEMQKQMAILYKEQGIAPVLGCLPMLLQMPIWIALYSAIYAGIEFRGAAFLPFWITDLSSPDALFNLPAAAENIPIIGNFIGSSFNLLPILLGAAMFAQQKLTPTSAPSTNPQAAQQQKMMMWMMPIMMLLFLYRAPSGLNLYIMSSTAAGVVEQYIIRKHIREKEALESAGLVSTTSKMGGKLKKKKPKPPIKFS